MKDRTWLSLTLPYSLRQVCVFLTYVCVTFILSIVLTNSVISPIHILEATIIFKLGTASPPIRLNSGILWTWSTSSVPLIFLGSSAIGRAHLTPQDVSLSITPLFSPTARLGCEFSVVIHSAGTVVWWINVIQIMLICFWAPYYNPFSSGEPWGTQSKQIKKPHNLLNQLFRKRSNRFTFFFSDLKESLDSPCISLVFWG